MADAPAVALAADDAGVAATVATGAPGGVDGATHCAFSAAALAAASFELWAAGGFAADAVPTVSGPTVSGR